ncbi:hypothetical protein C1646_757507 [Rhizophagus diaphanus]|nr:hypothetical protein C1646_757507 [Rhizophagus diaphanus] [Rhizophagus sp. MUCL 43196]
MASEPSSTTIASEPLTSTSEIRTDATKAFTVLFCEHIFHRICLGEYIAQGETTNPLCPLCSFTIELFREEAGDEKLMDSLGLVKDDSRARQGSQSKQVTMQDQLTSPIMIEDDASENNDDERTPDASNRSTNDRFQELLRELTIPVRGEPVEANDEEETGEDSVPKSLARLYQKAIKAGLRATKANQEEISCWYNYAKSCEDRVKAIRESDSRLNGQQAMTQVYNEVKAHLPDITMANLHSRGYFKLVEAWNSGRSDEYTRILEKLFPLDLADRHDHETPEMWCSCIRDPFRKLLEEHHSSRGGILSGNGYIKMFGKLIERIYSTP